MQSLFGTDGIRGPINTGIFVTENLHILGKAIGSWAAQKFANKPIIMIGHDTRHSAQWIKQALAEGIGHVQNTILDAQVIPTPLAAYALQVFQDINVVIIISASHNTAEDNGIKLIIRSGKLTQEDEACITRYYIEHTASDQKAEIFYKKAAHPQDSYIQNIGIKFQRLMLSNKKIVIDTAHGAVGIMGPALFALSGAQIIVIHNEPDGHNINAHCGSTNPASLQQAVIAHDADIGFAFDGDGDRVIAVNRQGIIKDGDDLLCLLLDHPDYHAIKTVVGTIMTNTGFEAHMAMRSIELLRTAVGDKHISEALEQRNLVLGGEPAGHIILRNQSNIGDGILVACAILETLIITHNWEMKTFTKYHQAVQKIRVTKKRSLAEAPFVQILEDAQISAPRSKILVRYSGTEPVLRVMVEGIDREATELLCQNLTHRLAYALQEHSS